MKTRMEWMLVDGVFPAWQPLGTRPAETCTTFTKSNATGTSIGGSDSAHEGTADSPAKVAPTLALNLGQVCFSYPVDFNHCSVVANVCFKPASGSRPFEAHRQ